MPFVDDQPTIDLGRRADPKGFIVTPGAEALEEFGPPRPGWNWGAAFRRNNELAALSSSESAWQDNDPEDGFNPWDKIKGTEREADWQKFVNVRNPRKFDAVARDIEREREDRKILDSQPWYQSLITEGAAGVLSPTTLMPGGVFVKGVKGGIAVVRSALSVGAATGVSTIAQEAALHSIEQTRTLKESAIAVGASTFLGGLLGAGGAALLSRGEWARAVDNLNRELGGEVRAEPVPLEAGDIPVFASAGAAATERASLDDFGIAGRAAGAVAKKTEELNPALRLLQSPNAATREVGSQLFENATYLRMNMEGQTPGAAVETLMKEWNGGLATALRATDDAYSTARKGGFPGTHQEFREEVGRAMRRADTHGNPEIDRVAKAWRAQVFDPLKEAAIKAGLLPEDVSVDTAASYFSRMWNQNKLVRREGEFKDIVVRYVETETPKWRAIFDRETIEGAAKLKDEKLREFQTERRVERDARFGDEQSIRSQAEDIARQVFDRLTGKTIDGELRPEFIKITSRGPLKERTFNIPDALVEEFLEHDVALVGRRYTRVMGADVELKNKFGDVLLTEQQRAIRDRYNELRAGVTDEKELATLTKAEKDDIRDITGVRDLLRGTYNPGADGGNWAAITRSFNAVNYLRSMGEVVLASLMDAIRPAMVHGLGQFMSEVPRLVANTRGVRLSVKEAQLAGNAAERVLMHRLGTLTEILDPYSSRGPVEALLSKGTDIASKWNGIRIWTDAMKSVASVMTQNRILDNVSRYADVKDKERSYLAFLGIDEARAGRIAQQFAEHGDTVDGVRVANTEAWTDEGARRSYRAAMNKDVDSIIVQKSVADVPLFAHTPTGRALLQFKTFALASHQRVLLRGLQEDQSRFVGGLIAMTAMGMFVTWVKALSGNRSEKLEDFSKNPGWWIAEGLDRSGILSVPMELSNMFEKASATAGHKFNPLKAPLTVFDEGSSISQKNQGRNFAGSIIGPSAGLVEDSLLGGAGVGVMAATGEDISQARKNALERLIPFNSYLGMRQMLRYVVNPQQP